MLLNMATTAIQRIEASARVASSTQELFDDGIEQLLSEAERKLSPGYAVNSSFTGGGAMAAPSSNDTGIFRMKYERIRLPFLQIVAEFLADDFVEFRRCNMASCRIPMSV